MTICLGVCKELMFSIILKWTCFELLTSPDLLPQIFSIDMKAIAGGLVTLVSWIGSFAISYSFTSLMDWNPTGKVIYHRKTGEKGDIGHLLQQLKYRKHFSSWELSYWSIGFEPAMCICLVDTTITVGYSYWFLYAGTFFLFSAASLVTVLFVAKLVPETKGRTLEEIQASFKARSWDTDELKDVHTLVTRNGFFLKKIYLNAHLLQTITS